MTGTLPAISVAMSVYNGEAHLAAAIESVLSQSFGDFEFLILDDGSADASRSIAEGYAARDPRIRLICRKNRGLVTSLNELFGAARAPLVARFDADDLCAPERFANQSAFLADHPGHGLVGCDTPYIDAAGQPSGNPPITRPHDHEGLCANLEDGPLICHSAVMVRRELVLAAGGYRPAYTHAEDYDLWLRLAGLTKLANLPEPLLYYRITPGQVSTRHMVEQARNAAIAWLAHRERLAGRPDPTEGMAQLPAIDALDPLFGPGSASFVRRRVVNRTLYSPEALAGAGWDILLAYAAEARTDPRLWRSAARLMRGGRLLHAARLAATLAGISSAGMAA